jgi:hypothetical protein
MVFTVAALPGGYCFIYLPARFFSALLLARTSLIFQKTDRIVTV